MLEYIGAFPVVKATNAIQRTQHDHKISSDLDRPSQIVWTSPEVQPYPDQTLLQIVLTETLDTQERRTQNHTF